MRAGPSLAVLLLLLAGGAPPGSAQTSASASTRSSAEVVVTTRASGTFDVKLTPGPAADSALGRMVIDKQFHGDLEATSKGEMVAAMTAVKGSAGYVALERVTGTLGGRRGSFVLQHSGTMDRGAPSLVITVVPDSGTDDLTGLSGVMTIVVEGGSHTYQFDYAIATR